MKPTTTLKSPTTTDKFNGALRQYRNINTGTWLFGMLPDKWSPSGLDSQWTTDQRQALADNGEVAQMLGLGSGEAVSATMISGVSAGASATKWDSILEQVAGGTHASAVMCRRSNKRKGGKLDVIRNDGARLEITDLW